MSDTDILVRVEAKVDVMNQRMDRHEMKNDQRFKDVFEKLDEVSERIYSVALEATKEDGKIKEAAAISSGELKAKIAGLSAAVSILMTGIAEGFKIMFGK